MGNNNSILVEKAFSFSLGIIKLHLVLKQNREYDISRQLLRSSTSIGANIEEARAASSRKDFINKMSIACKEAREAMYWLRLLEKSQIIEYDYNQFIDLIDEIIRLLTSSVKTAQSNLKGNN